MVIAFTLRKLSQQNSGEQNDSALEACKKSPEEAREDEKSAEATNEVNPGDATDAKKSGDEENKENVEKITREDLKLIMNKYGTVKYVDYSMGEDSGYIRFEQPEEAQKARAAAVLAEEGGLIVKNFVAMLEAVEGDAERDYWAKLRGLQGRRRENSGNNRGRGGRGRGGRQSFHNRNSYNKENKHRRSGENTESGKDERPNKIQKVEDEAEASKEVECN